MQVLYAVDDLTEEQRLLIVGGHLGGRGRLRRTQRVVRGTTHPSGEHHGQDQGGQFARPSGHTVLPVEGLACVDTAALGAAAPRKQTGVVRGTLLRGIRGNLYAPGGRHCIGFGYAKNGLWSIARGSISLADNAALWPCSITRHRAQYVVG